MEVGTHVRRTPESSAVSLQPLYEHVGRLGILFIWRKDSESIRKYRYILLNYTRPIPDIGIGVTSSLRCLPELINNSRLLSHRSLLISPLVQQSSVVCDVR